MDIKFAIILLACAVVAESGFFRDIFTKDPVTKGKDAVKSKLGKLWEKIPGKDIITIPEIGEFNVFFPKFEISGNLGSYLGKISESLKGMTENGLDVSMVGDLNNLMKNVNILGNKMPNKMKLLKSIFGCSKMSIQNKIEFAKRIFGLGGQGKDVSNIDQIAKVISSWDDKSSLIPDFKDLSKWIPGVGGKGIDIPFVGEFSKFIPNFDVKGNLGSYLEKISESIKGSGGKDLPFVGEIGKLISGIGGNEENIPNKLNIMKKIFSLVNMDIQMKIKLAKWILSLGQKGMDLPNMDIMHKFISNIGGNGNSLADFSKMTEWISRLGGNIEIPFIGDLTNFIPSFDFSGHFGSYLGKITDSFKNLDGKGIDMSFVGDIKNLMKKVNEIGDRMPNKLKLLKLIFGKSKISIQNKIDLAKRVSNLGGEDKDISNIEKISKFISTFDDKKSLIPDFKDLSKWIPGTGEKGIDIPFVGDFSKYIPNFDMKGNLGSYLEKISKSIKELGGNDLPFVEEINNLISGIGENGRNMPNKLNIMKKIFGLVNMDIQMKIKLAKWILSLGQKGMDLPNMDILHKFISNIGGNGSSLGDFSKLTEWISGLGGNIEMPFVGDLTSFIPSFDFSGNLASYLGKITDSFKNLDGKGIDMSFVGDIKNLMKKVNEIGDRMPNKLKLLKLIFGKSKISIQNKIDLAKRVSSLGGEDKDISNIEKISKFISTFDDKKSLIPDFKDLSKWIPGTGEKGIDIPFVGDFSKYIPNFDMKGNLGSYLEKISKSIKELGGNDLPFVGEINNLISAIGENGRNMPNKLNIIKKIFGLVNMDIQMKIKLAKWILSLGQKGMDLPNMDILHKFISNIGGNGNSLGDFSKLTEWISSLGGNIEMPFVGDLTSFIPSFDFSGNLGSYLGKITDSFKNLGGKGTDISFEGDLTDMKKKVNEMGDKMPNKLNLLKDIFGKSKISIQNKIDLAKRISNLGGEGKDIPNIEKISKFISTWDDKKSLIPDFKDLSKWIPGIGEKDIGIPFVGDFSKYIPNYDLKGNLGSYLKKIPESIKDLGGKNLPFVREINNLISGIEENEGNMPNKLNIMKKIFGLVNMDIQMKIKLAKWILSLGQKGMDLPNMDILHKFISNIGGNGNSLGDFSKLTEWISGLGGNIEMPFVSDLTSFIPSFDFSGNLGSYLGKITDSFKNLGGKGTDISFEGDLTDMKKKVYEMGDKMPNKLNLLKDIFGKSKISIQNKIDLAKRISNLGGEGKDIPNIEKISKFISTWDDKKSLIPDFKDLSKWIPGIGEKDIGTPFVGDFSKYIPNFDLKGNLGSYLKKIPESIKDLGGKNLPFVGEINNLISGIEENEGNMPNKLNIMKNIFGLVNMDIQMKIKLAKWILSLGQKGMDLPNMDILHKFISNIGGNGNSLGDFSKLTEWISGLGGNIEMPFVGDLTSFIPSFDFSGNLASYLGKITDSFKNLDGKGIDMSFVGDIKNLMKKVNEIGDRMPNKLKLLKLIFGKSKISIQNKIDLAKRVSSLGGEDKDISNIEKISKFISTFDDKKSLIPDFKDLSKWIPGTGEKGIDIPFVGDFSKYIPNFDMKGNLGSYLEKISKSIKELGGNDLPFVGEINNLISAIGENGRNMPNKLNIIKKIFGLVNMDIQMKIKLAKWILSLGQKGMDLPNMDILHKFISNIGGNGNSLGDFSKLTEWISSLGGNIEMPFVGDLTSFIPSFDFSGNLGSYLGKITDSFKNLGGKGTDISFEGDLTDMKKKVNEMGDKMPNKLNLLKDIFGKSKISIQNKIDLAKRISNLGGEGKDIPNIEKISKFISTWDDKKSLIPDFKDLSKWIPGIGEKDIGTPFVGDFSKYIPNFDLKGNLGSYLKKIPESIKDLGGKNLPFVGEINNLISGIEENEGNMPNKLNIMKNIFGLVNMDIQMKIKLAKWILSLGQKGMDLPNMDILHKFISNIGGNGNSLGDFSKLTEWISGLGGNIEMPFVGDLTSFIPSFDFSGNLASYLGKITDSFKNLDGKGIDMSFVGDIKNLMKKVNEIGDRMPNKLKLLKLIFGKSKISIQNKIDLAKRVSSLGGEDKDISNIEKISKFISTFDDKKSLIPDFKDLSKWIPGTGEKGIDIPFVGDFSKYIPNFDMKGNLGSYLEKISKSIKELGGNDLPFVGEINNLISAIGENGRNMPNKLNIIKKIFGLVNMDIQMKIKLAKWILSLGQKGMDLPNMDILHKFISNIGGNGNSLGDFSKLTEWISSLGGNIEMPFVGDLTSFIPSFDFSGNLGSYLGKITDSFKNLGGKGTDISFEGDLTDMKKKVNEMGDKMPNKLNLLKDIFGKSKISIQNKIDLAKRISNLGGEGKDIPNIEKISKFISTWDDKKSLIPDFKDLSKWIPGIGEKDIGTPFVGDFSKYIPNFDLKGNLGSYLKKIPESIKDLGGKNLPFVGEINNLISGIEENEGNMPNKLNIMKNIFGLVNMDFQMKIKLAKWILSLGQKGMDLPNMDILHKFISNLGGNGNSLGDFSKLTEWISGLGGNVEIPFVGDLTNFIPSFDFSGNLGSYLRKITDSFKNLGGKGIDMSFVEDLTNLMSKVNGLGGKMPNKLNLLKKIFGKSKMSIQNKIDFAKKILGLGGEDTDISNIENISKYISDWNDKSSLIPSFKDLSNWIFPKNNKDKGTNKSLVDYSKYITSFDKNGDVLSYLRKISELINGKDVSFDEELGHLISGIEGNENVIPNKLRIVKEIFKKVSMPIQEKTKLSNWVLTLGGRGSDLSNVGLLENFVSNIDGDGSSMEDFSKFTDWISSLGGNIEMPFIGDLSNFLPRHDLNENLGTYFRKITDSLKDLGGKSKDGFMKDLNKMIIDLEQNESEVPNKVAMLKDIFHKPSICMNEKTKISKFLLELGGKDKDIADFDYVDDFVESLQNIKDMFKKITGGESYQPSCSDFCNTISALDTEHFPSDILRDVITPLDDRTKYYQFSNRLISDDLGTAERSLCNSASGGRQLVSAYKDSQNGCKVHCTYQNEVEVLNSRNGRSCSQVGDYEIGICHNGICVVEGVA